MTATETTYTLHDDQGTVTQEITAADMDDAREQARDWAREGDWNLSDGDESIWVDVRITCPTDGAIEETVTVQIDPEAPKCIDGGEHDWQSPHAIVGGLTENPGVWGNGGGVRIAECCMRCGSGKHTDTWAQRPDTGEQGLTSVRYEEGQYTEALAALTDSEQA